MYSWRVAYVCFSLEEVFCGRLWVLYVVWYRCVMWYFLFETGCLGCLLFLYDVVDSVDGICIEVYVSLENFFDVFVSLLVSWSLFVLDWFSIFCGFYCFVGAFDVELSP